MGQLGAVLIGVRSVDGLPTLQAVESSIAAMTAWARTQTEAHRVLVLTDEEKPVTISDVTAAVEQLVDDHEVGKLLVYFAGHGFYKDHNDYWLLSKAGRWAHEAVSLRASISLAKRAGIDHVVFVSDACRAPSSSLRMADVSGAPVFPTQPLPGTPGSVDALLATRLGRPAYELRPPGSTGHVAAFTEVLSAALSGDPSHFVGESETDGPVVFSHALQSHLPDALERFLARLGVAVEGDQRPDLEIGSSPGTWISKLPGGGGGQDAPAPPPTSVLTPSEEARDEVRAALSRARRIRSGGEDPEFVDERHDRPWPFPGQVVFTAAGAPIRHLWSEGEPMARAWEERKADGSFIAVEHPEDSGVAVPVVVQLESGVVFTVMAAPETHVHLDTDGESLVSIRYSRGAHDTWDSYADTVVRRAVEAATRRGFFRPDAEIADDLIDSMRFRKSVDPALALYTAYALFDRADLSALHEMRTILRDVTGYDFFDLAMLEGMLDADRRTMSGGPGFPLLSQGWPLLSELAKPTARQRRLEALRRPGLWTSFDAAAWDVLVREAG